MPTGTALTNQGLSGQDCWDAADAAIRKALKTRPARSPASPPSSSPSSEPSPATDGLSETNLLRYVEGTLSPKEHMAVEALLLCDPAARGRVALLKAALAECNQPPQQPSPPSLLNPPVVNPPISSPRPPRYVLRLYQGRLQFIRCTNGTFQSEPEFTTRPPIDSSFQFIHRDNQIAVHFDLIACADHVQLGMRLREGDRPLAGHVSLLPPTNMPGGERLDDEADGEGQLRFPRVIPGRYDVALSVHAQEVLRVVLDIRST